MNVLGISSYYHDSAAALCTNAEIIAAAQEERFSRKKADARLPVHAIKYCLSQMKGNLDEIIYYDSPLLSLNRWINNCCMAAPDQEKIIEKSFLPFFGEKIWVHENLKNELSRQNINFKKNILVCEHHISHAASAFYPSPFENAAILTMDGVGEWATATIGVGKGNHIEIIEQMNYPNSVGLLYSGFTYFCGFKVNFGEYKLMGLAPYGVPMYEELIRDEIVDIKKDGSIVLNLEYFAFLNDDVIINVSNFEKLFKTPIRRPEEQITRKYMDIAASIQKVTEEIVLKMALHAKKITGCSNLAMAGGTALNCVANGKLVKENIFENIWIQPAASDAGGALGAALYATYQLHNCQRHIRGNRKDLQKNTYLGPQYSNEYIAKFLKDNSYKGHYYDSQNLYKNIARYLNEQKVIGLFHGRMEFGPRALGNRSIIASATLEEMQSKLNLKIKYRESFRPFAPSVLKDRTIDYFDLNVESPYMLLTAPVKKDIRVEVDKYNDEDMIKIINQKRSSIPAVTHVDYSARIQTVDEEDNPYYYSIIKEYEKLTGYGVIVNTSFNVRGEPIVCSPEDAYMCFMRTEMDVLVLENYILLKEEQPKLINDEDWRALYELD